MLEILEFMFSDGWKFAGCFVMFFLILGVIEGAIANICNTITNMKKLKYLRDIKKLETSNQKQENIKPPKNWD